jgi:regulator of protease activity HflC (stomatin/prohibitin superfamily)
VNGAAIVVMGVAVIVAVALILRAVVFVPQHQRAVVERLGRYRATLPPGLNLVAPFLDQVRVHVETRPQELSVPPRRLEAADRRHVLADAEVRYAITDPGKTVYAVADHASALDQLTVTILGNFVAGLARGEAVASVPEARRLLLEIMDETVGPWGLEILGAQVRLRAD